MKLEGKTTFITGAAGGLGLAVAKLFYKEGSNLILFDKSAKLLEFDEYFNDEKFLSIIGDVTNEEEVNKAVESGIEKFGAIDILICSSGIAIGGAVSEIGLEDWNKVLDVNVNGVFLSCRAVLKHMVERKYGRIVNIASHFGEVGAYKLASYCASKAAVIQITKSIALDYSKNNIIANCVAPGFMDTEFLKNMMKTVGKSNDWMGTMYNLPMPSLKAEKVAKTVLYAATDATEVTTGSVFTIDGGYTAR